MVALRFACLMLLVVLAWAWIVVSAPACDFCKDDRGPTLLRDFEQAAMVLVGTFGKAQLGAGGIGDEGTSDFRIKEALKSHDIIKGKSAITLPKAIQTQSRFLIFCEVYKGSIDPYRGEEIQADDREMIRYM